MFDLVNQLDLGQNPILRVMTKYRKHIKFFDLTDERITVVLTSGVLFRMSESGLDWFEQMLKQMDLGSTVEPLTMTTEELAAIIAEEHRLREERREKKRRWLEEEDE